MSFLQMTLEQLDIYRKMKETSIFTSKHTKTKSKGQQT